MKRLTTVLTTVFAALLLALTLPTVSYASETDGVTVALTSDKDAYQAGEAVTLTVEVENASNVVVTDVAWQIALPDGVEVEDATALTGTVAEIRPHMTWTGEVVGEAAQDTTVVPPSGGSTEENPETTETDKTPQDSSDIPATGDAALLTVGVLVVAGVVAVGFGLVSKKRGARTFVILAVLVATAGAMALPAKRAYAADTPTSESASCTFTVNGTPQTASVSVAYQAAGDSGSDGSRVHYALLPGVASIEQSTGAGTTFTFPSDDATVAVGDMAALEPTDENPEGAAGTVTGVTTADGFTTITIDQAENAADVFKSVDIKVRTEVDFSEFEPDADFKWGWPQLVKRCNVELENELDLKLTGSSGRTKKSSFLLNKKPISIPLSHGLYAFLNFKAEVSLNGEVSVTADIIGTGGVTYKQSSGFDVYAESDADVSIDAEAKFKAYFAPYVNLNLLSAEIIDVQTSLGPGADAKHIVRPTGMVCNQVDGYLGWDVSCGENTLWMDVAGLTFEKTLWDEDNSPLKFKFHFEDGTLVDDCTWREPVEPDNPDEPEDPDTPVDPDEPEGPEDGVTPESDFEWTVDDTTGRVVITNYIGASADVVVPATIDSKPVGAINGPVFMDPDHIKFPDGLSISFEEGSQITYIHSIGYNGTATIAALDLSNATELTTLTLYSAGGLEELDFSGLTKLEEVDLRAEDADFDWDADTGTGNLAKVTFKDNDALTDLTIISNSKKFVSLDLSEAPAVKWLEVRDSGLRELDLSGNSSLIFLYCTGNDLRELDLSAQYRLQDLEAGWNYLTSVKLPDNGELKIIDLNNNLLETLDVSPLASNCWQPELQLQYNRLSTDEVTRLQNFQEGRFPDADWTLTPQGAEV